MYNNCINECADPSNWHIFYAFQTDTPGTYYYFPYYPIIDTFVIPIFG